MRKKPKYMLLQFKISGSFMIVEREWYDFIREGNEEKIKRDYRIVRESNDYSLLKAMGVLTERLI